MAKLIVLGDKAPAKEYELGLSSSIGRHPSQTIQLLDRLVSKEHAVIEDRSGVYILRDLQSRNGTFVNNRMITEDTRLQHGDKLLLGSTRLVYMDAATETRAPQLTRVTIAPELIQSAIAAKIAHSETNEFVPETAIKNEAELRRDYERLRIAYKLQRDIALEVDLDKLLQKIMDSLFESRNCDRGAILLIDPSTGQLATECVKTRRPGQKQEDEISISHTIIDQVVREKTAVLSSDASVDSRFSAAHSVILQGIRSTMCVPLVSRNDVLGVIHLDSLIATGAFTERDLNLVQGLGTQAAMAIENSNLVRQRTNDAALREKFSRLLSPNLVDQLVEGTLAIEKGGQNRQATVLFSDLRGFTSMSERKEPQDIVEMLNEFFEIMVDAVFEFEGTLDKFMGDGIMAVWNCPVDIEQSARKAVQAGLKMQQVLREFNEVRVAEGLDEMRMGIGIDTGDLVAGYMGSTKTMSYTVIGPPVNLASRLCGVAEAGQVLVSGNTLETLGEGAVYQALDPLRLKGIRDLVTPYNVTGLQSP